VWLVIKAVGVEEEVQVLSDAGAQALTVCDDGSMLRSTRKMRCDGGWQ